MPLERASESAASVAALILSVKALHALSGNCWLLDTPESDLSDELVTDVHALLEDRHSRGDAHVVVATDSYEFVYREREMLRDRYSVDGSMDHCIVFLDSAEGDSANRGHVTVNYVPS